MVVCTPHDFFDATSSIFPLELGNQRNKTLRLRFIFQRSLQVTLVRKHFSCSSWVEWWSLEGGFIFEPWQVGVSSTHGCTVLPAIW
jgi:hypothetical protein